MPVRSTSVFLSFVSTSSALAISSIVATCIFICLTSSFTDKQGNVKSRINPLLTPGDIVTDPRSQAYYIVTEYGGVNLVGCSTWERAEKLVSIAHPMFRDDLIASAEKQGIWIRSNKR